MILTSDLVPEMLIAIGIILIFSIVLRAINKCKMNKKIKRLKGDKNEIHKN